MKSGFLRVLLGWCVRLRYRVTALRPEHVPSQGGALIVSNHVSFVDLLLILASTPRLVRFLLPAEVYERRWLRPFLRSLHVIPLPPESRPRDLQQALGKARQAVLGGEVVGIFAEREISRIGTLLPFRREFEQIMEGVQAPIIPVCINGVWGSVSSYQRGRFCWRLPSRVPPPVTITFGRPLPPTATAFEVRTNIQELDTEAWLHRRARMEPIHRAFVRRARRCPFRFAMADLRGPPLRFASVLGRTLFLARRLRPVWDGQDMVGLLLPPSVPAALVNLAALLAGKIPVNLNYTLGEEPLASCVRQCRLETILTSRAVAERLKLNLPGRTVFLEDLLASPKVSERLVALGLAWLSPQAWLERAVGRMCLGRPDDLATVIFSSGSTGDPKGVMLSHGNLVSNAEQLSQLLNFDPRDRFLGILPFFHSFGFTATLVAPAMLGIGVAYHPTPLEAKPIGELVRRHALTYLMATPTFLQIYLRACEPADFGSLRFVMVSAEKLPEWLATAFEEKYGLRPMEGYGCTECSPVVTCSTHEVRAAGLRQVGSRRGSIGRPLPGVSVRLVSPETGDPVPLGQPGLLLVRGPNVMGGYLNQPERTAEVLRDGWYVTGDIAKQDEDGFLQITDRLSRFSKIGGEMVPHGKVEEKLHEAAGVTEITFAVTAVPDAKKGERLIVLHTLPEGRIQALVKRLPELGLPNLWIPRGNQFFQVESLPKLASGKMDLRRIKELAATSALGARPNPDIAS